MSHKLLSPTLHWRDARQCFCLSLEQLPSSVPLVCGIAFTDARITNLRVLVFDGHLGNGSQYAGAVLSCSLSRLWKAQYQTQFHRFAHAAHTDFTDLQPANDICINGWSR